MGLIVVSAALIVATTEYTLYSQRAPHVCEHNTGKRYFQWQIVRKEYIVTHYLSFVDLLCNNSSRIEPMSFSVPRVRPGPLLDHLTRHSIPVSWAD